MKTTVDNAATLELPFQKPHIERSPFEPPLFELPLLTAPPLPTGSVALNQLLAREGFKAGQLLHLYGGGVNVQRSIVLGWVGATIAHVESSVLFDLGTALTEEAIERAGLKLLSPDEVAETGLDVDALGDAKGYCRVAQSSTWGQLYRTLDLVYHTASSPTLVIVWGLEHLISKHIEGRATPTNLAKVRAILGMLKEYLTDREASGHTVVFIHSPGGKEAGDTPTTGAPAQAAVSPALRGAIRELLFTDFALGLDIGRAGPLRKCGRQRFIQVPVQPRRGGIAWGRAATIELWHESGQFKNP